MEEFSPPEMREHFWAELKSSLEAFSGRLSTGEFPYGGKNPIYADFVLLAAFKWMENAGPEGGWERIKGWKRQGEPMNRWERLYDSCSA